jgi:hypothetical protein
MASTANRDDLDTSLTAVVVLVGAILTFVAIVAVQALFYQVQQREFERKVVASEPAELRSLQADQLGDLNSYRWIDKQNGVVAIPIDEAMKRIVEEESR